MIRVKTPGGIRNMYEDFTPVEEEARLENHNNAMGIQSKIKETTMSTINPNYVGQFNTFLENFQNGRNLVNQQLKICRYGLKKEEAQWIIYVRDVSRSMYFELLFSGAKRAGWIPMDNAVPYPKAIHVGLKVALGNDGNVFGTRSSKVVCLVDLLDEAKNRSKQQLIEGGRENEWTAKELENAAKAIGYEAVNSKVVQLVDFLDKAKNRRKQQLIDGGRENEWRAEELENAAEAIGY